MTDKAILCVDDESIILLSLKQELSHSFGDRFVYETALSAEDALETISALTEDGVTIILVISDWLMPGMKGDEFLEKVYEEHPNTKVIMITGHANQSALDKVNAIPSVCGVLKKPWDPDQLKNIVEEACPV